MSQGICPVCKQQMEIAVGLGETRCAACIKEGTSCPRCKQAPAIENSHTADGKRYCLSCTGIMLSNEEGDDEIDPEVLRDLELGRELIEGHGVLKGQKTERAQILYHLRALAHGWQEALPNSPDARLMLDIAFMIENRQHWTKHEPGDREYDER